MPCATLLVPEHVQESGVSFVLHAVDAESSPVATRLCGGGHGACRHTKHRLLRTALAPFTRDELWLLPAPCRVVAKGRGFILAGIAVPRSARAKRIPVIALYVEEGWEGSILPLRLPFPWTAAMIPGDRVLLAGLACNGELAALRPRDVDLWMDTNRHEVAVPPLVRGVAADVPSLIASDRAEPGTHTMVSLSHALLGASLQANPVHAAALRRRDDQAASRVAKRVDLALHLQRLGASVVGVEGSTRDSDSSEDDEPTSGSDMDVVGTFSESADAESDHRSESGFSSEEVEGDSESDCDADDGVDISDVDGENEDEDKDDAEDEDDEDEEDHEDEDDDEEGEAELAKLDLGGGGDSGSARTSRKRSARSARSLPRVRSNAIRRRARER